MVVTRSRVRIGDSNGEKFFLDWRRFYETWNGHEVYFLKPLLNALRADNRRVGGNTSDSVSDNGSDGNADDNVGGNSRNSRAGVFLAGDSSLDNKYWIVETANPSPNYVGLISRMKEDVCFHMNAALASQSETRDLFCINGAVEATTLGQRLSRLQGLTPQDVFIQSHITSKDVLVVSVGGNDIAMAPSMRTIFSMLSMVNLSSDKAIADGRAWGWSHFERLFRDKVSKYIQMLTEKCKPRLVVVCMIYYPHMQGQSWADVALGMLKYNSQPERLQLAIRTMYERATCAVNVPGVRVVQFPLYSVMDGSDARDYVARVEPSTRGGQKMAKALSALIAAELKNDGGDGGDT